MPWGGLNGFCVEQTLLPPLAVVLQAVSGSQHQAGPQTHFNLQPLGQHIGGGSKLGKCADTPTALHAGTKEHGPGVPTNPDPSESVRGWREFLSHSLG